MPTTLVRWVVSVTWCPNTGGYTTPVTRTLWFLMPASTAPSTLTQMAVRQMAMCNATSPSTIGTPTIDTDTNDYDRNDVVMT